MFQLFCESPLQPLRPDRARPDAGLAFERHPFSLDGVSLANRALSARIVDAWTPERLPPAHVCIVSGVGRWTSAWLQRPETLYAVVASPVSEEARASLGLSDKALQIVAIPRSLRDRAWEMLLRTGKERIVLLADPEPSLLQRQRLHDPLIQAAARLTVPYEGFAAMLAQCAWMLATHERALPALPLCLYAATDLAPAVLSELHSADEPVRIVSLSDLRPALPPYTDPELELEGQDSLDEARIAASPALRSLSMRGLKAESFDFLAELPALRRLAFDRVPWRGLGALARAPALRSLSLVGFRGELASLRSLPHLDELELDESLPLQEVLTTLRALPCLRSLTLHRRDLADLQLLEGLPLERLEVSLAPLRSLAPLASMGTLRALCVDTARVTDLSPLRALPGLEVLSLRRCPVTDLRPLTGLALSELELEQIDAADLAPLGTLTALRSLRIAFAELDSLAPLEALAHLQLLELPFTRVRDGASFAGARVVTERTLQVSAWGESPLDWSWLPRLRPTAGLAYERHAWAPDAFEVVAGLALRHNEGAGTRAGWVPPDRVALDGPGLAPLVAALFAHTGATLLCAEGARLCTGNEALQRACLTLLQDPEAQLVAGTLAASGRPGPLQANVARWGRAVSSLHPVPGLAVYQSVASEPLEWAVRKAAQRAEVPLRWLEEPPVLQMELGLPRFEELPAQSGERLDLQGYNLAQLPDQHPAASLVLDHSAIVDLSPLRGWENLRELSLRGLELSSLQPTVGLTSLTLESPRPAQLRELRSPNLRRLVLHGGHLDDLDALRGLPSLETLELHDVTLRSLRGLQDLGRLHRLELGGVWPARLEELRDLPALRSLTLRLVGHFDAAALPSLPDLEALEIACPRGTLALAHPDSIASLRALRSLTLTATDLADTAWLVKLERLRALSLVAADLADCEALGALSALERLDLTSCEPMDLAPLQRLEALRELRLPYDAIPVSPRSPGLRLLAMSGAHLPDLQLFSHLTELQTLELGRSVASLRGVERLEALETLDVTGAPLSDLGPLAALPRLAQLRVGWTQVADLAPLAGLRSLRALALSRTHARDLAALRHLPLERLDLGELEVDLAPLRGLPLRELVLRDARLASFEPLQGMGLQRLSLWHTRCDLPPRLDLPDLGSFDLALLALDSFEPLRGLARLRELKASHLPRRPDLGPLLALPPLSLLELDRSRAREEHARALQLRHRVVWRGE